MGRPTARGCLNYIGQFSIIYQQYRQTKVQVCQSDSSPPVNLTYGMVKPLSRRIWVDQVEEVLEVDIVKGGRKEGLTEEFLEINWQPGNMILGVRGISIFLATKLAPDGGRAQYKAHSISSVPASHMEHTALMGLASHLAPINPILLLAFFFFCIYIITWALQIYCLA